MHVINMKNITALIVLVSLLASCQVHRISVNLYAQPELIFPPEVTSILVTSKYVPATGDYEDVQWGAYESVDSLRWMISESVVDSLATHLQVGKKFQVKPLHFPRMFRHNGPDLPEPQPWGGMQDLARKEFVRAILVIESFDLDRSGVSVTTDGPLHQSEFSVDMNLGIRVYEPIRQRMLDDSVYAFRREFRATGSTAQEAMERLPSDTDAFLMTVGMASGEYARKILPRDIPTRRFYYHKGDSLMVLAHQALLENRWGSAESRWKWLTYNAKDTLTRARASFNMALACERDGRMNQAIGFARRAYRLHPDKRSLDYIAILEEKMRIHESEVLSGQKLKHW